MRRKIAIGVVMGSSLLSGSPGVWAQDQQRDQDRDRVDREQQLDRDRLLDRDRDRDRLKDQDPDRLQTRDRDRDRLAPTARAPCDRRGQPTGPDDRRA